MEGPGRDWPVPATRERWEGNMTEGIYMPPMTEAQAHSTLTRYRAKSPFAECCLSIAKVIMVGLFGLLCFLAGQHFPV